MTNKQIRNQLLLASSLMELHGENPFKAKSYNSAAQIIDNTIITDINTLTADQLETIDGIGKKVAAVMREIAETGSFDELDQLVTQTPAGIIDMLGISGLGVKKISSLWKELNVEDLPSLLEECQKGNVAKLKGFGEKTQTKIEGIVLFNLSNKGKRLYAEVEEISATIENQLKEAFEGQQVFLTGQMRMADEIVDKIEYLVEGDVAFDRINQLEELEVSEQKSSPFIWRGKLTSDDMAVEIKFVDKDDLYSELLIHSSSEEHLAHMVEDKSLMGLARSQSFDSEENIYKAFNMPFVAPEMRIGDWELNQKNFNNIIQFKDLQGCLHNHSVYSDGKNTVEEMALQCKEMGYSYFGISDHSKSAFYANGLYEDNVKKQQDEVDHLNNTLEGVTIFKGIESDILNDGNLDYSDDVLASFDFIVSSIHSNLNMDMAKATTRLLQAIENPYTTMLGHATGRLLLRREAYPIHHAKIIDACAENNVIIELNANPWRLDIDWRWIQYCMDKGVMISINPDAHITDGIYDMYYGTLVARKGGLTKDMCFNAKSSDEVATYFKDIKKKKGI